MSGNQSSTFNPPPEVTPPPEQPEVPPVPEIPEVPPPVQDNPALSETITPPEQFADPPRNEVPQPDPANFQVGKIFSALASWWEFIITTVLAPRTNQR